MVDQTALRLALIAGEIAGAALDVTDPEPLPAGDPLLEAPNLLVVPHVGSATVRTRERMAEMAVENLLAALAGRADALPGLTVRVAVVDIGTNSTRLLVADVGADGVEELDRRSVVTRLGEGVDATGRLGDGAAASACSTRSPATRSRSSATAASGASP